MSAIAVNQTLPVYFQTLMYVMNQSMNTNNTPDSYNYYLLNIGEGINSTRCYGVYGCFPLGPPWTSENRPVSLYPEGFNKLQPVYLLYTRRSPFAPTIIDLNDHDMIKTARLDPNMKLYVISHGYMDNGNKTWVQHMKNELLAYEECSVIVVDWGSGSGPPYTQAVANIRLIGAMTAHLLAAIAEETWDLKLDHVHLIGHSLGAHLSGYVSYTLQRDFQNLTVGRITGLDPAEPHFAKTSPPVRLDRSAAKFVDVIHTDGSAFIRGGLGMTEKIGHVDFFPNGGTNQPGCNQAIHHYVSAANGSFIKGIRKSLACNHIRAYEYFTESIRSSCPYMSIACNSYEDLQQGKCFECNKYGQYCVQFGMQSENSFKKLKAARKIRKHQTLSTYLMTGPGKPFCRAHYRITVRMSDDHESKTHGGEIGQLWIVVYSEENGKGISSERMTLNPGGYHAPGEHYKAVVPALAVPRIKSVEVEWDYQSSLFNPLTWRLLTTPKIYVDSITIDAMESGQSVTICPAENKALVSKRPQFMSPAYCS